MREGRPRHTLDGDWAERNRWEQRMRGKVLASFFAVAVFAVGCSDCGGDQPEPDAGPRYTADNACLQIAQRQCEFYVRCSADPFAAVSNFEITDGGLGSWNI